MPSIRKVFLVSHPVLREIVHRLKHRLSLFFLISHARKLLAFAVLLTILSCFAPAANATREHSIKAPLASRSLLLDGCFIDGLIVTVGERGHILISQDHGQSWRQTNVPTQTTLTGVFFHDRKLGWAVGHDTTILRTSDGGENWECVYCAPENESPLLDVWFRDAENGFAIGAYGFFLVTSDGGDTWSNRPVGASDYHLNHIAKSETGKLYIAAEAGMIYRSHDDGETWVELPSPYEGSFFGTLPLEGDALLLFGLRGHMYRSEDAGETWEQVETKTEAMLTDGIVLDDTTILVAGLGGALLLSRNEGASFTLRQQEDRKGIATLIRADDETVVAIGEFGVKTLRLSQLLAD
jgi:photosystem II stability/assembly factor-like uncharacterized protein